MYAIYAFVLSGKVENNRRLNTLESRGSSNQKSCWRSFCSWPGINRIKSE